jgi:hypothetical protein
MSVPRYVSGPTVKVNGIKVEGVVHNLEIHPLWDNAHAKAARTALDLAEMAHKEHSIEAVAKVIVTEPLTAVALIGVCQPARIGGDGGSYQDRQPDDWS